LAIYNSVEIRIKWGKKALPVGLKYEKRGEVPLNRHFSLLILTGLLPKGRNDWSSEAELRSATPNPEVEE